MPTAMAKPQISIRHYLTETEVLLFRSKVAEDGLKQQDVATKLLSWWSHQSPRVRRFVIGAIPDGEMPAEIPHLVNDLKLYDNRLNNAVTALALFQSLDESHQESVLNILRGEARDEVERESAGTPRSRATSSGKKGSTKRSRKTQ